MLEAHSCGVYNFGSEASFRMHPIGPTPTVGQFFASVGKGQLPDSQQILTLAGSVSCEVRSKEHVGPGRESPNRLVPSIVGYRTEQKSQKC
jgi:hypothetical protein